MKDPVFSFLITAVFVIVFTIVLHFCINVK